MGHWPLTQVDMGSGWRWTRMVDANQSKEKRKRKEKNLLEVLALAFCGEWTVLDADAVGCGWCWTRMVLDADGVGCGWCWMRMVLDANELKEKEKKRKRTYAFSDVSAGLQRGWMRGECGWMVVGNRSTGVVDTDRWWWATGMMDADGRGVWLSASRARDTWWLGLRNLCEYAQPQCITNRVVIY